MNGNGNKIRFWLDAWWPCNIILKDVATQAVPLSQPFDNFSSQICIGNWRLDL